MQAPVTIVIPTHRRPALLRRALEHYAPSELPLLVADSSPDPQPDLPPGVTYHHLPGMGIEAKLERMAALVETPLAVLCADDDFTSTASILRCAEFLLANPDHSAAHGHYLRVLRQPAGKGGAGGGPLVEPCYLDTHNARIDAASPGERLLQLNRPYVPLFYAVARAEALRLAFGPGHGREAFYASSELALGLAVAMLGKVAVLPTLHTVRDIVPSQDLAGGRCDDLGVVSVAARYAGVYGLFVERLAGELARRSGLEPGAAREAVLASLEDFTARYCQRGGRRPLYKKLPKYGRRLARALVPGEARRQDEAAEARRRAALSAYLAPAGPEALAVLDDILAKLAASPG